MSDKPVQPRADRVLPGVWRLRLPLPWPGVPHGNAWAIATDDGVTMFDTGIGGEGALPAFETALGQAGFGLGDIKRVVCTHSHADHYGLAGPLMDASGYSPILALCGALFTASFILGLRPSLAPAAPI